jgi:hypothetical protein
MCAQQPIYGIVGASKQPVCNARTALTTVQQDQTCDVNSHQAEGQRTKRCSEAKGFECPHDLPEQPTCSRMESGRQGGNTSQGFRFGGTLFYPGGVPFAIVNVLIYKLHMRGSR